MTTEIEAFVLCGYTLYRKDGVPHRCDRDAVASAVGPHGERVALCRQHERVALAWASRPQYADWRVESGL